MIKLKIKNQEFYKFKTLLNAENDDRSLGLEALKNTDTSLIMRILLGKSLTNNKRHAFVMENKDIEKYMIPWNELFKEIKKLKPSKEEEELITKEFSDYFITILNNHHGFIKNIKIELKW